MKGESICYEMVLREWRRQGRRAAMAGIRDEIGTEKTKRSGRQTSSSTYLDFLTI